MRNASKTGRLRVGTGMSRSVFALWMAGLLLAAMPASAVYYVSHWDFSSDPSGEFDITGHNDLVNEGNVPIVDLSLIHI